MYGRMHSYSVNCKQSKIFNAYASKWGNQNNYDTYSDKGCKAYTVINNYTKLK